MKTGYPSIDKNHEKGKSFIARNPIIPKTNIYNAVKLLNIGNKATIETLSLTITTKELLDHAKRLSASLCELGVKKGDIITICTPNFIQSLAVFFAANRIGVGVAFINAKSTDLEMVKYINLFESKVFMGYDLKSDSLDYISKKCNLETLINMPVDNTKVLWNPELISQYIGYNPVINYNDFVQLADYYNGKVQRSADVKNNAIYAFTSGSTGSPKIPILTNENVLAASLYMSGGTNIPIKNDGKCLVTVPFNYPYGLVVSTIMPMMVRKSLLLAPDINLQNISDYMERKPTRLFGIPPFYFALCSDKKVDKMDLSFVESAVSGGDTLLAPANREMSKYFREHGADIVISNGSGNAETTSTSTVSVNYQYRPETVGYTLPGTINTTVDPDTHEELRYGEDGGVIATIGKHVSKGYFKDPENTKKHFTVDKNGTPMFISDTKGIANEDGSIEMNGRLKRYFITFDLDGGAYKCDNAFVEKFVTEFSEVFQCALVPRQDAHRGNVGKLYVVLKNGIDASDELKQQLLDRCSQKITVQKGEKSVEYQLKSYEIPSDLEFVETLPINFAGKTDFKLLEELANQKDIQRVKK